MNSQPIQSFAFSAMNSQPIQSSAFSAMNNQPIQSSAFSAMNSQPIQSSAFSAMSSQPIQSSAFSVMNSQPIQSSVFLVSFPFNVTDNTTETHPDSADLLYILLALTATHHLHYIQRVATSWAGAAGEQIVTVRGNTTS